VSAFVGSGRRCSVRPFGATMDDWPGDGLFGDGVPVMQPLARPAAQLPEKSATPPC